MTKGDDLFITENVKIVIDKQKLLIYTVKKSNKLVFI